MKVKVVSTCYRFKISGETIKVIRKVREFNSMQDAREFIERRKNRWSKIWGYRTKANYWYANKTCAYVAFSLSNIHFEIKKK